MVNLLFCGNDGVFDGLLTASLSIMMRTESREPFCFRVFTMDVSHLDPKYVPISREKFEFFRALFDFFAKDGKLLLKKLCVPRVEFQSAVYVF